ncbi:hypothetical protein SAMN02983003_3340 [Devosia enhydra]|uniref:Uncharacterized protein n=1 Tax=Devosia enhydra TaxID=665118 RepID=A0A1K2I1A6_9HYPH|nr:hypothetical protein [Devosia enhydra]SFZ86166.1 hypothetical protein SAMN02983003_3340 [Devosia enhydra]
MNHHLHQSFARFSRAKSGPRLIQHAHNHPALTDEGRLALTDSVLDEAPMEVEIIGLTPEEQARVLKAFPGGRRFQLKSA